MAKNKGKKVNNEKREKSQKKLKEIKAQIEMNYD